MRQIIILLLITNFAFGQKEKVTIDPNVVNYEIQDEFERFDDIARSEMDFKNLDLNFITNSELEIKNSYGGGFIGYDISFKISKPLKIKDVTYNYWTDNVDLDNVKTYKVKNANLTLNQNPFDKINGLRGKYILEIEHYLNGSLTNTETFKGKFRTFKGSNKKSADYQQVMEQERSSYLNPDKAPRLKSSFKTLIAEIRKIKGAVPNSIKVYVVINEKGKIEKAPIRFAVPLEKKVETQIKEKLIELTEWYPACLNNEEVKSRIPIIIGME